VLLDWQAGQLCEQGLGEVADFWMTWDSGRKRTAKTMDGVGLVMLFKFCDFPQ